MLAPLQSLALEERLRARCVSSIITPSARHFQDSPVRIRSHMQYMVEKIDGGNGEIGYLEAA